MLCIYVAGGIKMVPSIKRNKTIPAKNQSIPELSLCTCFFLFAGKMPVFFSADFAAEFAIIPPFPKGSNIFYT